MHACRQRKKRLQGGVFAAGEIFIFFSIPRCTAGKQTLVFVQNSFRFVLFSGDDEVWFNYVPQIGADTKTSTCFIASTKL